MVIIRRREILSAKAEGELPHSQEVLGAAGTLGYGLAVDIGTTTVSLALYDLFSKKGLRGCTTINRQTTMGKDVMMRLMHCIQGRQAVLHEMIIKQLEEMAGHVWEEWAGSKLEAGHIQKMVVVGNPAMCHIFLNQPVDRLAGSPFQAAYEGNLLCYGRELGMELLADTQIQVLSGIGGHVGGDAMAVILQEKLTQDRVQLAVDIGTNAEIILNNRGHLTVCSAAAGPAFEGMGIACGMRGENGAIASVRFAPQVGNLLLEVLQDAGQTGSCQKLIPRGICGSGLVDAMAQLVRYGVVKRDGYLLQRDGQGEEALPDYLRCCLSASGERRFYLWKEDEGQGVYISQEDIRNFQAAKAAVQAGMKLLLRRGGVSLKQVEEIKVAGTFGSYVSRSSGELLGLFPVVPPERMSFVGNAAGRGAAAVLLDEGLLEQGQKLSGEIEHMELADSQEFRDYFLKAMELSPWKE